MNQERLGILETEESNTGEEQEFFRTEAWQILKTTFYTDTEQRAPWGFSPRKKREGYFQTHVTRLTLPWLPKDTTRKENLDTYEGWVPSMFTWNFYICYQLYLNTK